MRLIVYITRPSKQSIARSICLKKGADVVVSLDDTVLPGKVEMCVEPFPIQQGERLTYDQVLMLLFKADKVITL